MRRRPVSLSLTVAAALALASAGAACGKAAEPSRDSTTSPAADPGRAPESTPSTDTSLASERGDQGSPPSSALPVRRRSDPSIDRYTRSPREATPRRRMTGAQRWLSARSQPFVAHDSDPRVSLNLTGWATRPEVHAYVNATGVGSFNAAGLRDARRWLLRRGGTLVKVDEWVTLDVRQRAARRWWLFGTDGRATCTADRDRRAALDLIACGYGGLWVDNVLTDPGQRFTPDPGIDAAAWGEGVVALMQELRAALPPQVPFTVNAHWTDLDFPYADAPALDPRAPLVRAATAATQLVIEGGAIDAGINYGGTLTDDWSFPRLLAYADALHTAGARVQWEKTSSDGLTAGAAEQLGPMPSCRDGDYPGRQPAWRRDTATWRGHVRTAGFNLATALLTFAPGDSVGDMCEYPGRGFDGYGVDLGAPIGPRSQSGALTVRAFERGYVAVNPSLDEATLTLPEGRSGIDVAVRARTPGPPAAVHQLPPRTAAIIRF